MGVGEVTYGRVLARMRTVEPPGDARTLRSFAWLVTGMMLEQDVRLPRIALAMVGARTMDARVRRLRRCLDGRLDGALIYRRLLRRAARCWHMPRAFLILDTTSVAGRVYFARVALCHASRALPLAWTAYAGQSATVAFDAYVPLLAATDNILPRHIERVLLADRGFMHLPLVSWCLERDWRIRVRTKGRLGITLPDGTWRRVSRFQRRFGVTRYMDTVYAGAAHLGPLGLLLTWPRYGKDRNLHILSLDPPNERTLWEYERREALETAFKDDKSAGFQLERSHITEPQRMDQLLADVALAQLFLKSIGTRIQLDGDPAEIDAHHGSDGLSVLQLGARQVRKETLLGRAPTIEVALWPDDEIRGREGERAMLKRFHARKGLPYARRWIPPGSFEERNTMWWLPKRYRPRIGQDEPPVI